MISSLIWIPRGVPERVPSRFDLTDEEYAKLAKKLNLEVEDSKILLQQAKHDFAKYGAAGEADDGSTSDDDMLSPKETNKSDSTETAKVDNDLDIYNLDDYDKDEESIGEDGKHIPLFSNVHGLVYYGDGENDPYITVDAQRELEKEEAEEERQDLEIMPSDNMLVTCKTVDDISQLEVYVYEEGDDNLYVHHDVLLSSFPLCVERLSCNIDGKKNLVAVGTFEPEIEIWNLDVIDVVIPELVLGGGLQKKKRSKECHTDAVLGMSSNKFATNLLASCSADRTVKLWDLGCKNPSSAMRSFAPHSGKVSTCQWHPTEASVLASGGYDRQVCVYDTRTPENVLRLGGLAGEVETVQWNPHSPEKLLVATDNGLIRCFDVKNTSKSLFTLQAHDKPVTTLQYSPFISNCLLTGSEDKTVKLWNLEGNKPTCVVSRDVSVGKVFTASWSPDTPLLACVGGSLGNLIVWNLWQNKAVRSAFYKQLPQQYKDTMNIDPVSQRSELTAPISEPHPEGQSTSEEDSSDEQLEQKVKKINI